MKKPLFIISIVLVLFLAAVQLMCYLSTLVTVKYELASVNAGETSIIYHFINQLGVFSIINLSLILVLIIILNMRWKKDGKAENKS